MVSPTPLAVFTLLLVLAGSATAADLPAIPRTIAKEPAYKTKPKYCLLVFGTAAKTRIWLVLDGDVLYVDKNGNGDLTEKDKRLEPHRVFLTGMLLPGQKEPDAKCFSCEVAKNKTVQLLKIDNDSLQVDLKDSYVKVGFAASHDAQGNLRFADKPHDAPIIHFAGPMTFHLNTGQFLERGDQRKTLFTNIGTPGLGPGTFASITCEGVPASLHPIVEAEFPSKKPHGETIKRKFTLNHRC
jgi:hypothetical protein